MTALLVSLLLLAPPEQPAQPDLPEKDMVFAEAAAHYQAGRFDRAARRFEDGWALSREPAFLFNAGTAWMKHGDKVRAANAFERFLSVAPADRRRADERLTRLARSLSRTHGRLEVRVRPDDAVVTIDGTESAVPRWVPKGPIAVAVKARGYVSAEQTVKLAAGDRSVVSIGLRLVETGELIVVSNPAGASVWIGGVERGLTPLAIEMLTGEYAVDVVGATASTRLSAVVRPRATTRLDADLGGVDDEQPLLEKWWLWTIVGAVVVAGVTTAVVVSSQDDDTGPASWGVWAPTP